MIKPRLSSLFYLMFFLVSFSFGQKDIIRLGYNFHFDIWKPWSKEGQNYNNEHNNVFSDSWSLNLQTTILNDSRWRWNSGLKYKRINYKIIDRLNKWNYQYSYYDDINLVIDTVYYLFNDPADLIATSNSWGILNQVEYGLLRKEKFNHFIGLEMNVYLYERYDSYYASNDFNEANPPVRPDPIQGPRRSFYLYNVSGLIYWRSQFSYIRNADVAVRVAIGSNLYSDWNQFKRYAWVGLGLELGFGHLNLNQKNEPNNSNE